MLSSESDMFPKPGSFKNLAKYAVLMSRTSPYEFIVQQTDPEVQVGDKRYLSSDIQGEVHVLVLGVYDSYERAHFVKRTIEGCNEEQCLNNLVKDISGVVQDLRSVSHHISTSRRVISDNDQKFSPNFSHSFIDKTCTSMEGSQCSSQGTVEGMNNHVDYIYYDLPVTSTPFVDNKNSPPIPTSPEDHEPLSYSALELIAGLAKLYHIGKAHKDTFFAKLLALLLFKGEEFSRREDQDKWSWILKSVIHFFPESQIPNEAGHIRENRISSAVISFCKNRATTKKNKKGKKMKDNAHLLADLLNKFNDTAVRNTKLRYSSMPSFGHKLRVPLNNKKDTKPNSLEAPSSISLASITCEDVLSKSVIHSGLFRKEQLALMAKRLRKKGGKCHINFAAKLAENIMDAKRSRKLTDEEKNFIYETTKSFFNRNDKFKIDSLAMLDREVEKLLRK
ncbi:unnamed protein product [Auanema sp. JU1783]|nr:unnamed protein product [Auanema sp. JU1783]